MTRELYEELKTMDALLMKINGGADHFLHNIQYDAIISKAQLELFSRTVSRSEFNCPRCVFKLYKAVATAYAEEKNKEYQKLEPTNEVEVDGETVTTKKRNAKRKSTKTE